MGGKLPIEHRTQRKRVCTGKGRWKWKCVGCLPPPGACLLRPNKKVVRGVERGRGAKGGGVRVKRDK